MQEFDKLLVDHGDVESGKEYPATYRYLGDKQITQILPSCGGCTRVDRNGNEITLTYTASRIDSIMVEEGINRMLQSKKATVFFNDGSEVELHFNYTLLP